MTLDIATVQQALDALITGDDDAAGGHFSDDVVLTGSGALGGRTSGLRGVLARFADVSRLTRGTFGTEVEALYRGGIDQVVVVTRHWARIGDRQVFGDQAVLMATDGDRIRRIDVFARGGATSGIWD